MNESRILDWKAYEEIACKVISEGCVLLENKGQVLPFKDGSQVSVFGRIQLDYYKSGTGSGGMVNVSKVYGITEGLELSGKVEINKNLLEIYTNWCKEHPYEEGEGWGKERWSQDEMPLSDEVAKNASAESDVALVVIGRTAGEDRDATDTPGSYRLTDEEMNMMATVRKYFTQMVVVLNVGNVIDMSFMDSVKPDAVLYVWQGGMMGGIGTARVLTGETNPSGRLTDSVAYRIEDYPSDSNFGDPVRNFYQEDIYVGYRYFETFAPERIRYPFGCGLSYTTFETSITGSEYDKETKEIQLETGVINSGEVAGKNTVLYFVSAPQGKLGKPAKVLSAFHKTKLLAPGEEEKFCVTISAKDFASYDDSGVTNHKSAFVLEAGEYVVYCGGDAKTSKEVFPFTLPELEVIEQLEEALAPVETFERMKPVPDAGNSTGCLYQLSYEKTPLATIDMDERRKQELPSELPKKGEILFSDVFDNKATVEEFVGGLSDYELCCMIRGEGMGSMLVTPGTASAFAGVTESLRNKKLPAICCDDGPSGMRLDCGIKAFSLPNGTLVACTFNEELIEELYSYLGLEMISNQVDCILGPGLNIHRHPLNGRNFEYYSEDPYVTGRMATAQLKGLKRQGVSGCIKHFCGNNQEYRRREIDSVISERALREIYLRGFEIPVKEGVADAIMTTYGLVNGLYTAGSYDLNTTILRNQWKFDGIVMTDWWAFINERGMEGNGTNFGAMVRAQNDLYMVCKDATCNADGDNIEEALNTGLVTRAELQRCAVNICRFALHTEAMKRMLNKGCEIEIVNRPKYADDISLENVEWQKMLPFTEISLENENSSAQSSILLPLDLDHFGNYEVSITASSELSELAQIPCTLFVTGIPTLTFTFNGTGGRDVTLTRLNKFGNRFAFMRLYVGGNGLKLKKITFRHLGELSEEEKKYGAGILE